MSITAPVEGETVSGTVSITATVSDDTAGQTASKEIVVVVDNDDVIPEVKGELKTVDPVINPKKGDKTTIDYKIGTELTFIEEGDPLPLTLRTGLSYRYKLGKDNSFILATDLVQFKDQDAKYNLGAEYNFKNMFSLRLGYKMGYDLEALTFGFGFFWNGFQFDLSQTSMETMDAAMRTSFSMKPTPPRPSKPVVLKFLLYSQEFGKKNAGLVKIINRISEKNYGILRQETPSSGVRVVEYKTKRETGNF